MWAQQKVHHGYGGIRYNLPQRRIETIREPFETSGRVRVHPICPPDMIRVFCRLIASSPLRPISEFRHAEANIAIQVE